MTEKGKRMTKKAVAANVLMFEVEPAIGSADWRPTQIHPLAALFPMLAPDDLQSLADDIKENGLRNPIVVDADGVLIDGRNRAKACDMAGVGPTFTVLQGVDREAFIWSVNAKRRQMTKSQIAMVAAMGLTLDAKARPMGGVDEGKAKAAKAAGISASLLSQGLLVRQHAADLAQSIIIGLTPLHVAYEQAKARKKAAEWLTDGLRLLREAAPDLATRVTDGEIDIEQGRKMLEDRLRAEAAQRDSVLMGMAHMTTGASKFDQSESLRRLPEWMGTQEGQDHFRRYFKGGLSDATKQVEEAERGLAAVKAVLASMTQSGAQ